MKNNSLRAVLGLCAVAVLFTGRAAFAQASLTGTYTQNFDGLGTGTSLSPLPGWSVYTFGTSHDLFSPPAADGYTNGTGVAPAPTASGQTITNEATLVAGTPGTQRGVTGYNWAANGLTGAGSTDRSLGSSPSGNAATVLELTLTNNTGAAISALSLTYDIDRFTTTTNNNSAYNGTPDQGVEEFPGYWLYYSLNGGSSWTTVGALDIKSLDANMNAPGSTVSLTNTTGVTTLTDGNLVLSSALAAGANIEFAWVDDNAQSPSPDQLIGLNNLSIAAVPEPGAGVLGLVAVGAAVTLLRLRRQQA